ncbi:IclR family transcriptional regulator [Streptomyces sparsus]
MTSPPPGDQISLDIPRDVDGGTARSKLSRGLALLDSFRSGESEVTLSELARRTGLPKPTVHRLIKELVERGFLERGNRGVRLGHCLFTLGSRAPLHQQLRRIALPRLEGLHAATRGSAYLSMPDGTGVVHLDSIRVPMPAGNVPWHDEHHLVLSRAASRAIGSRPAAVPQGTARAAECAAVPHGERGGETGQEEAALPRVIVTAHHSVVAVAAPIVDLLGAPLAAITVVSATHRLQPKATGHQVQRAAAAIAWQLNGVGDD